jgi:hypothetical protein
MMSKAFLTNSRFRISAPTSYILFQTLGSLTRSVKISFVITSYIKRKLEDRVRVPTDRMCQPIEGYRRSPDPLYVLIRLFFQECLNGRYISLAQVLYVSISFFVTLSVFRIVLDLEYLVDDSEYSRIVMPDTV